MAKQHLGDDVSIEYFAVSLPDFLIYEKDYSKMNHVHCLFVMALAYIGLGKWQKARELLGQVLVIDPSHVQANLFAGRLAEQIAQ